MFFLIRRVLPYLMVLGGVLLLLGTLPALTGKAETAPTPVEVVDISANSPTARWLRLTGGGLYLPDALVDEEVKEKTGARKVKAWYVPFVAREDALNRAEALLETHDDDVTTSPSSPTKTLVLVQFKPDEFLSRLPHSGQA